MNTGTIFRNAKTALLMAPAVIATACGGGLPQAENAGSGGGIDNCAVMAKRNLANGSQETSVTASIFSRNVAEAAARQNRDNGLESQVLCDTVISEPTTTVTDGPRHGRLASERPSAVIQTIEMPAP
ncbi:MAG: hypothetical protein WDO70_00865 [Alphaproteobacteria bacterium]